MILYNGEIAGDSLDLPVMSDHFQYGTGFFETLLYEGGQLCFFDDHLERIERTCRKFHIRLKENDFGEQAVLRLLDRAGLSGRTLRIKILYAPLRNGRDAPWDTVITAHPYVRGGEGIRASLHDGGERTGLSRYKAVNYEGNLWLRNLYREKDGTGEVLFGASGRRVLEGSYTNVLIRKKQRIYYVHPEAPYLFGVAQKRILEWAGKRGYRLAAVPGGLPIKLFRKADETLLTNSLLLGENLTGLYCGDRIIHPGREKTLRNEIRDFFTKDTNGQAR